MPVVGHLGGGEPIVKPTCKRVGFLVKEARIELELLRVDIYELTPGERADWRAESQPVWEQWKLDVGAVGEQIIDIALDHNPLP